MHAIFPEKKSQLSNRSGWERKCTQNKVIGEY